MNAGQIKQVLSSCASELLEVVGEDYVTRICEDAALLRPLRVTPTDAGGFDFDITDVLQNLANLATIAALAEVYPIVKTIFRANEVSFKCLN